MFMDDFGDLAVQRKGIVALVEQGAFVDNVFASSAHYIRVGLVLFADYSYFFITKSKT